MTGALLDAVPANLRSLASPYVGIVSRLEESMATPDEPRLITVSSETAQGEGLVGASLGHSGGMGGTGFSHTQAVSAAIGEAVERYSGCHLPIERFVLATATELGPSAVAPSSFALFHDTQYAQPGFSFAPFTSDLRIHWVDGTDLATGEPAWLPVELVFLTHPSRPHGVRIGYATSSGMACGGSREEAMERGLFELLERDAFMLVWSNRLSLPRLDWSSDESLSAIDAKYFAPTGLEYAAIDLSAFHGFPTVLGVVRAPGTGGALGVGAAAAAGIGRAWWKALSEAFASRSAGWKLALVRPDRTFADGGSDILTFEDHIQYYSDARRAEGAAFLAGSTLTRAVQEIPRLVERGDACLTRLVERIALAGSGAFAIDVTAPDVAATGLHVVKTVAPGLCALDVPHRARFLGSPRLLDASERAMLTQRPLTLQDLNPLPHPFP
ncbi:MAG: YcaO-like family protein [Gaiellaceae bacterium MAG52_C11]|nr:YcaO-like family protein [Candidatus Gaiellasilicea maunaloa]